MYPRPSANPHSRVVIKIGGAMLHDSVNFADDVFNVCSEYADTDRFLIVGGGTMIDAMRELHVRYPHLDNEEMHWRCVRMLDATWEIACELLPFAQPIREWDELDRIAKQGSLIDEGSSKSSGCYLIRVDTYYNPQTIDQYEASERPQIGWQTTTDALAWLLAVRTKAQRVVLLKRAENIDHLDLAAAATRGVVDPEIARLQKDNGHPLQIHLRQV